MLGPLWSLEMMKFLSHKVHSITGLKLLMDFSTHIFTFQNALTTGSNTKLIYWKRQYIYYSCRCIITLLYCQPSLWLLGFLIKESLVMFIQLMRTAFVFSKVMFNLYCLIQTILQKLNKGILITFFCSHFYSFFRDDHKFIYCIWLWLNGEKNRASQATNNCLLGQWFKWLKHRNTCTVIHISWDLLLETYILGRRS